MARDITALITNAATQQQVVCGLLASFAFDSGTLRMWSGVGDLTWNGNTYTGAGNLSAVSEVKETQQLQAEGLLFSLSGVPTSLISIAMTEKYKGRPCTLHLALFGRASGNLELAGGLGDLELAGGLGYLELAASATDELLDSPVQIFSGYMDVMEIEASRDTCTIKLSAENELLSLKRTKERRYTDADQQARFTGDLGLSRINQLRDKRLTWGTPAK